MIEPTIAHVIDEVAVWYAGDKFIRAVEDNARFDESLRTVLRRHERGFAIMRGDARLAMIYATRALIPHREVIHANFLIPGPRWQQVSSLLHGARAEPGYRGDTRAGVPGGRGRTTARGKAAALRPLARRPRPRIPRRLPEGQPTNTA